ncbi:T4 RnlA family RNA ligase [Lusitaniella coriacea LEGE 07157]|uniref:T4 RnlA family RNA ligase n=1 Tax=Lusitaniella coriacea LEGE 07157 TaxID=945747 RepID=A0A8J7DZ03_9CYAN|nr:T4 RnlA family RNA ligase [Lusitaniella coriacea]MBE9117751.1 T4 RnlA family RNA ligase [Lusitaniella coriacea LEGE 07157]
MKEIKTLIDITNLLKQDFNNWRDFGYISVGECGDLRIFNYTAKAQFEGRWNYLETVSRGLILHAKTGEVVARPFDKFFNWGERNRFTSAPIKSVTEKMDGSLGILYRLEGKYRIATRGSFDSEQAIWATQFLEHNYDLSGLPSEITLLFEIIYPGNRIVVDYRGREDLVLLAMRNRVTGEYYPWQAVETIAENYGISLPAVYTFDTPEQLIRGTETLNTNSEGWVVEFLDGQRFKFKGEEYCKLHKLISGLSFKKTLEQIANGTFGEWKNGVPDEFLDEVNAWSNKIQGVVEEIEAQVEGVFQLAPKNTRKEFALWAMKNHKSISSYLFAKLDGRPLKPLVYKLAFQDSLQENKALEATEKSSPTL